MTRKIYIYTTNTYLKKGWFKIGETFRDVDVRVNEQDTTSNPEEPIKIFETESILSDTEIHKILTLKGFNRIRDNREWFEFDVNGGEEECIDLVKTEINKIISTSNKDTRVEFIPRFYQDVVKMMFIDKYENDESSDIDFALELAPRFGKTIWAIDIIHTLFKNYGYKLCVLPTYYLSALSSFEKDFYGFKNYSNEMVYVKASDNLNKIIDENYGKKMIIVENSLHMENYEEKLRIINELPKNEKLTIIDEADFGSHRVNSQNKIRFINAKLNVYMTGTAIERVSSPLKNLRNNIIRWSYTDMLMVKKGEHPLQKNLV